MAEQEIGERRLTDEARARIETHANQTGTKEPPIPVCNFESTPPSDTVRQRIEAAAN